MILLPQKVLPLAVLLRLAPAAVFLPELSSVLPAAAVRLPQALRELPALKELLLPQVLPEVPAADPVRRLMLVPGPAVPVPPVPDQKVQDPVTDRLSVPHPALQKALLKAQVFLSAPAQRKVPVFLSVPVQL